MEGVSTGWVFLRTTSFKRSSEKFARYSSMLPHRYVLYLLPLRGRYAYFGPFFAKSVWGSSCGGTGFSTAPTPWRGGAERYLGAQNAQR